MSKEKIEVGDWVHLVGPFWKRTYPDAPEYVRVTEIEEDMIYADPVADVGSAFGGLYSPGGSFFGDPESGAVYVPESEVPDEIRFKDYAQWETDLLKGSDESVPEPNEKLKDAAERLEQLGSIYNHDPVDPKHYQFPSGVEVRQISGYLTGFGAQALQYVARATRMDDGNKGDRIEDLRKSIKFIEWEIERLEATK